MRGIMGLAFIIVATRAFMQHPVGYTLATDGSYQTASFRAFLFNP